MLRGTTRLSDLVIETPPSLQLMHDDFLCILSGIPIDRVTTINHIQHTILTDNRMDNTSENDPWDLFNHHNSTNSSLLRPSTQQTPTTRLQHLLLGHEHDNPVQAVSAAAGDGLDLVLWDGRVEPRAPPDDPPATAQRCLHRSFDHLGNRGRLAHGRLFRGSRGRFLLGKLPLRLPLGNPVLELGVDLAAVDSVRLPNKNGLLFGFGKPTAASLHALGLERLGESGLSCCCTSGEATIRRWGATNETFPLKRVHNHTIHADLGWFRGDHLIHTIHSLL